MNDIDEIEHSQIRAILGSHPYFSDGNFLDIHTFADLPASAGMGSSSSFTVGMLNNLYLMNNVYKTAESLSIEAINIERNILKEAGGWQDQIFAAYGGFNRIDFFNDTFTVTPIVLSPETLSALEASCMLFFTNKLRSSKDVQDKLLKSDDSKRIYSLNEIKEYVDQAYSILIKSTSPGNMVQEFGMLLNKTWESKKNLVEGTSNEDIDHIYQLGMDAGAYGGKLCGAGGGGFILFIVAKDKQEAVANVLQDYHSIKIRFENYGSRPIYSKMFTN
ncbi:kinase [Candidatus Marinimicrobia bacterium MT.SAG.2]|nr:kinase [Candidatus Marinimicrobia bacterium MT.SAG.2]